MLRNTGRAEYRRGSTSTDSMDYDSSREMRLFTLRVTVLSVVVSVLL